VLQSRAFRAAPPSNQGKWFARRHADALRWLPKLYPAAASAHVLEVEVPDSIVTGWFALPNLDGIGPAVFADVDDLPALNAALVSVAEV
jgi:hypothetical protein